MVCKFPFFMRDQHACGFCLWSPPGKALSAADKLPKLYLRAAAVHLTLSPYQSTSSWVASNAEFPLCYPLHSDHRCPVIFLPSLSSSLFSCCDQILRAIAASVSGYDDQIVHNNLFPSGLLFRLVQHDWQHMGVDVG